MSKYIVRGMVTISIHTEVEATTKREAVKIAKQRGMVGLCHQCSTGEPGDEWVTSGELDGEPIELSAEKCDDRASGGDRR